MCQYPLNTCIKFAIITDFASGLPQTTSMYCSSTYSPNISILFPNTMPQACHHHLLHKQTTRPTSIVMIWQLYCLIPSYIYMLAWLRSMGSIGTYEHIQYCYKALHPHTNNIYIFTLDLFKCSYRLCTHTSCHPMKGHICDILSAYPHISIALAHIRTYIIH